MGIHYKGDVSQCGEPEPFRVAVRDGVSPAAIEELRQTFGVCVNDDPTTAQAALIRSATKFPNAAAFKSWPELMLVGRVGVGVDNINMEGAAEMGVATINTPGGSTEAVARRALTFILNWAAKTRQGTDALAGKEWPKGDPNVEPVSLDEKTLGVVGYGRIGQETGKTIGPFFGKTVYFDPHVKGGMELGELLRTADVISVHAGGDKEVLTAELLRHVKPGSLLVNTSRGGVINAQGLLDSMDRGIDVALDIFPEEGAKMFESDLIRSITAHPRFTGTPHTAASDPSTQKKLAMEGATYVQDFAQKGTVNERNLPGHTLPRMSLDDPTEPVLRAILTHRSVTGTMAKITGVIGNDGIGIHQISNAEGSVPRKSPLAITGFDLQTENIGDALKVMQKIREEIDVLHGRLMLFGNGEA